MSDLQNQKYRIEQMRQALNQFSKTANDALGNQYLNADTLKKLGIEVPPVKTAFWITFIFLAIFLSIVTQFFLLGVIAIIYAIFKFVSEMAKREKFLENHFLEFALVEGESNDERFPLFYR